MKLQAKLLDHIVVLLIVLTMGGALLSFLLPSGTSSPQEKPYELQGNWQYTASGEPISLPTSLPLRKGVPLSLEVLLPKGGLPTYTEIYFSPYYYDLDVFLEGEPLLEENFKPVLSSNTNGSRTLFVSLPPDWAGKMLTMVITPQLDLPSFKLAAPALCFESQTLAEIYRTTLPSLIATNVILWLGFSLFFLRLLFYKYRSQDAGVLALALFSLLCGTYLSTQLSWSKLMIPNATAAYITEFVCHLLLPLPLLLLLKNALAGRGRKLAAFCLGATLAHASLEVLLFLFTDIEFREMLPAAHVQLVLLSLIAVFLIAFGSFQQPGQRRWVGISLLPIIIFSCIDVVLHYFVKLILPSVFLEIGFFLFVVLQAYFLVQRYLKIWEVEQRAKAYETLAYIDILTGLKNRNAYESDAQYLDKMLAREKRYNISCIVMDADHLKRTNDEEGHAAGDLVIRTIADQMKTAFPKNLGIYRMGGDEFMILLTYRSKAELTNLLDKTLHNHAGRRFSTKTTASFSYGISDSTEFRTLKALTAQADAEMYAMKQRHREAAALLD